MTTQAPSLMPASMMDEVPAAMHRGADDLPYAVISPGVEMQLLQVDLQQGLWVIRQRMAAGITLPMHRHTGQVLAFTLTGSWRYLEYPEVNVPGSYLNEPAGSVHTLHVPVTNKEPTDVWFAIFGANLNLDVDGRVASTLDAHSVLKIYLSRCIKAGLPMPDVIGAGDFGAKYWRKKQAALKT